MMIVIDIENGLFINKNLFKNKDNENLNLKDQVEKSDTLYLLQLVQEIEVKFLWPKLIK